MSLQHVLHVPGTCMQHVVPLSSRQHPSSRSVLGVCQPPRSTSTRTSASASSSGASAEEAEQYRRELHSLNVGASANSRHCHIAAPSLTQTEAFHSTPNINPTQCMSVFTRSSRTSHPIALGFVSTMPAESPPAGLPLLPGAGNSSVLSVGLHEVRQEPCCSAVAGHVH